MDQPKDTGLAPFKLVTQQTAAYCVKREAGGTDGKQMDMHQKTSFKLELTTIEVLMGTRKDYWLVLVIIKQTK